MLNNIDLEVSMEKAEYEGKIDDYITKLGVLQRELRTKKVPVIIVIEGWHYALRGPLINKLIAALDPRGFWVHSAAQWKLAEGIPYFAPFWRELPPRGGISIYNNGWYFHKMEAEVKNNDEDKAGIPVPTTEEINAFEEQLAVDGYLLIKIFLHISSERQGKNLNKMEKLYGKDWNKVMGYNSKPKNYDKYYQEYDEVLTKTDTPLVPWHIIPSEDERYALIKTFEVFFNDMERHLAECSKEVKKVKKEQEKLIIPDVPNVLAGYALNQDIAYEEYKEALDAKQKQLCNLQFALFKHKIGAAILFEGWDAAGKGGAIKRLTAALHPLGYRVVPICAPNIVENEFHYLWRFWQHLPETGRIIIFDRTWYGRVLVERIEQFTTTAEWKRAYREINLLENEWVESGIPLAKFWLQIDQKEQLKRFKEREKNPDKQWKITQDDWRNRAEWPEYETAVNEMLYRTDTQTAPWTVVEANSKYFARLKVLDRVIALFEQALQGKGN